MVLFSGDLPSKIAYCFDDVIDLPVAERCGLMFMVEASPLFTQYVLNHRMCDYLTASEGHEHAVREITEMSLGLLEIEDKVFAERAKHTALYISYLKQKNEDETLKKMYDGKNSRPL